MPSYLEELCQSNRVGRDQKDTGEPLAVGSIGKRCRDARRLQAHWQLENTGELDFLQILSPDNVKAACAWDYPAARVASNKPGKSKDGTAAGSIDSVCKSAIFLLRQHYFKENGSGVPLPQAAQIQLNMLERLSKQHADQRNKDKPPPPALALFHHWGKELHDSILAWAEEEDAFHDQLALDCMALVSIFGVPARSGALRDYKWGHEITMLEDGDIQFEIGTPDAGASKNGAYAKFLRSELTTIGQTRLLRPDLVASALKILYEASDKSGYVFSRTANGKNQFGAARLRDAFKEKQLCIGELRRRIETDADRLLEQGTLSAEDRERVTYVSQHTVDAADRDYVQRDTASDAQPEGSAEDEHAAGGEQQHETDDQQSEADAGNADNEGDSGDGPDDTNDDGADELVEINWVSEVARRTRYVYVDVEVDGYVTDENLMQLNGALAMAYSEATHDDRTEQMLRYASAYCSMVPQKRRRIE
eukprot:COSAG02_NODE_1473_length_12429_cov_3.759448_4_plen_477_part_00